MLLAAMPLLLAGCSLPSWMGGKTEEKPKLAGERIKALPVASEMEPDAALKITLVVLPPATPNNDWPQHGGTAKAADGNLAADGAFSTIASATIGHGEAFENTLVTLPVVGGGTVFAMDSKGYISAHDAAHIETVRWQSKGVSQEDEPDVLGGGLAYDLGKLYVTSGRGIVAAFDAASGKELWHKSMRLPFQGAPKVAGDKLFALTLDNQTYALNAADGNIVWSHRGINETSGLLNAVSPVVMGDVVIIPYSSGEVYVLAVADGKEVWADSLSSGKRTQANALFAGIGGDPIVDSGVVISVSNGGSMMVHGLAGGQRAWERPIGSMNTPWLAGDNLFVLSTDNTLLCLLKYDGRVHWATQLQMFANVEDKKDPISWKGPVLVNGKLAVVGSHGQLLLVSAADGKIAATQTIPENIYTPPVVAAGRMYLVGQDAKLYSLK